MRALLASLLLPIASAHGADCPPLHEVHASAWEAFTDAELEIAQGILDEAIDNLACQQVQVGSQELFDLFELAALVAIGNEDEERAVYAVLRAIAVYPEGTTRPDFGPELAELFDTWSTRLVDAQIPLQVRTSESIWLDGRALQPGSDESITAGDHLLQRREGDLWTSDVLSLDTPTTLVTEGPLLVAAPFVPALTTGPALPSAPDIRRRKRTKTILWLTGAGLGAAGTGLLLTGLIREQDFLANPYDAASYGGCAQGSGCWAAERDAVIDADAQHISILYGVGYGALAAGVGLTVSGIVLSPTPGGAQVGIQGTLP